MNLTEVLIAAILSLAVFGVSYSFYTESRETANVERTAENLTVLAGNIRSHMADDQPGLLTLGDKKLRDIGVIPDYFVSPNQADAESLVLKSPFGAVTTGTGTDGESTYWTVNLTGLSGKDCYRILRTARAKNLWDGAGTTKGTVVKSDELTDTKLIELCGKAGYNGSALVAMRTGTVVASAGGPQKKLTLTGHATGGGSSFAGAYYTNDDGSHFSNGTYWSKDFMNGLFLDGLYACKTYDTCEDMRKYLYDNKPAFFPTANGEVISSSEDEYTLAIDNEALNSFLTDVKASIVAIYGSSEKFDTYMAGMLDRDITSVQNLTDWNSRYGEISSLPQTTGGIQSLQGQFGIRLTQNADGSCSAVFTNSPDDQLLHLESILMN